MVEQDTTLLIADIHLAISAMAKEIGAIKDRISQQDFRVEKLQSENMKLKARVNEVELLAR
jgi:hypothetical protein